MRSRSHAINSALVRVRVTDTLIHHNHVAHSLLSLGVFHQKAQIDLAHNSLLNNNLLFSQATLVRIEGEVNPELTNFY